MRQKYYGKNIKLSRMQKKHIKPVRIRAAMLGESQYRAMAQ